MASDGEQFKGVSNVGVSENGVGGELTLTRQDGQNLHLRLYKDDFVKIIDTLTELAIAASAIRTGSHTKLTEDDLKFSNVEVQHLAIARSDDDQHLFLVLRFFDFDLSYKVGVDDLRAITDGFAQTVANLEREQASIADGAASRSPQMQIVGSALENGSVRLKFIKGTRQTDSLDMTPAELSYTVVGFLTGAKQAQEAARKTPPRDPNNFPVAEVSLLTVVPGMKPKHGCFVAVSGEAVFGISIPPHVLRGLGERLIKLAAAGERL